MRTLILLLISVALYACEDRSTSTDQTTSSIHTSEASLVFGGTILTMDTQTPTVTAMVLENGKIAATGAYEPLREQFPNASLYDLEGRTVIPGVIDSHVHVYQLGAESLKANLVGTDTVADMVARLKAFFPNPKPGEWLIGQGWDEGAWATRGYPDRRELDAAFPGNPLLLQSLHGFAGFYNGAALKIAGIDKATPDPEVGQILRRADGEASGVITGETSGPNYGDPTGVFLTLARDLVEKHAPPPTIEQVKAAILSGLTTLSRAGVTTIHEAGVSPTTLQAFQELAAEGKLPTRVYGLLDGNNKPLMDKMFNEGPILDPEGMFTVRGIKVFYDGSLGSRTALLKAPYSDKPEDAHPTERISIADVTDLAEKAALHGFQMAVHTIGDEGNDRILQTYKSVLAKHPKQDHRWRLEHAQVVLPSYYEQVADMWFISSMQPSHAVGDSGWAEERLGPERIKHAYAWRTIKDTGGKVVFNSDLPGEPWKPMQTLYFAATRQKLDAPAGSGWYIEEALTVNESLQAMTSEAAYAGFQEDMLGKLIAGYQADFIELSADPTKIDPNHIKDIQVVAAWLAGKKIHTRH